MPSMDVSADSLVCRPCRHDVTRVLADAAYGISEKKCNIPLEFHTGSMEWKANFPFPIPHTTGNPLWPGMLSVEWKSSFPFHTHRIVIHMYIHIPAWKAQSWNTVES